MSHDQAPLEKAHLDQGKFKSNRGKLWLRVIKILFLSVCINSIPFVIALLLILSVWLSLIGFLLLGIQLLLTLAVFLFLFFSRMVKLSSLGIYFIGTVLNFCVLLLLPISLISGLTPLHLAAWLGQDLIVRGLLLTGSNVDGGAKFTDYTPLILAIQAKHPHTVQILLEAGAENNPNILVKAVESEEPKTVQILLKAGANPNGIDTHDRTPLCAAAENGNVEITKVLLQAGATTKTTTTSACSPLQKSVQYNNPEVTNLLIQAGAAAELNQSHAFCSAAEKGNIVLIRKFLQLGANLQQECLDGGTPLGVAARNNQIEAVKLFLSAGADPNNGNVGSLSQATIMGHTAIAQLLIQHGAQVNPKFVDYYPTPLTAAVEGQHTDTVKLLLASGADVNQIDGNGISPLAMAAGRNNTEVIKLLLKAGSKLEPNPLNRAAAFSTPEVVKLLIEAGCDVNKAGIPNYIQNDIQPLPLMAALQNYENGTTILKLLIAKGAKLNVKNDLGEPIMITAIKSYNESSRIRVLIEAGADLNQPGSDGKTPLQLAKESGYTEIVQLLEQAGAK